jgi:adenosylcobinamide-GDP ribazoletransferase
MRALAGVRTTWWDFLSAVQFLTRFPVPSPAYAVDSLARSVKFFPLVGLLVGGSAVLLHRLLVNHVSRLTDALLVLGYLVLVTGCLQEDALADVADGFGGGRDRDQILLILRDSRIGSYGAAALAFSIVGRVLLIAALPMTRYAAYLITAQVLARWTVLPLSCFLSAARRDTPGGVDGQGARIARLTSTSTLVGGTLFSFVVAGLLLRSRAIAPIVCAIALAFLTGVYYKRRIGGVTGDCFGATIQLTEIGVYLCGAWL